MVVLSGVYALCVKEKNKKNCNLFPLSFNKPKSV